MNGVRIAVPAAAGAYFRIALQSYDKFFAPPNSAVRFRPVFNINSAVFQQSPVFEYDRATRTDFADQRRRAAR